MPTIAGRDNGRVSPATKEPEPEVLQRPLPRRGRGWVLLIGFLALLALGYGIVNIATQKPNKNTVHIEGIGEAQQLFGGVPQEGARLGSEDAPVTVQVFGDEQSSLCREGFLTTIPELTEKYARRAPPSSSTATTRTRKTKSSTASTAPKPPPNRATAGSTRSSSTPTRTKPTASASPKKKTNAPACGKTSSTHSPAAWRNSKARNGRKPSKTGGNREAR